MVWLLYVQDKLGNAPWMPSCEMDVTLFFPCSTHMRLLAWLASSLDPFTPHFSLLATQSSLLKPSLLTHSAILAPSLLTQSCIPCPLGLTLPPPSYPPYSTTPPSPLCSKSFKTRGDERPPSMSLNLPAALLPFPPATSPPPLCPARRTTQRPPCSA